MIQDILPKIYDNKFAQKQPKPDSLVLIFNDNKVLCKYDDGQISYPFYSECKGLSAQYIYLFAIDDIEYFLADTIEEIQDTGYAFASIKIIRKALPKYQAFAGICAYQFYCWYRDNRFCGRCGSRLLQDNTERKLFCEECKNSIYPHISPAVIVAVTDGNRLLMTKYAGRDYKDYALIAGFSEVGEQAEETVAREVKEEVGLRVKNITYYSSQPWSFSGSLLLGFFAEVDGDTTIIMDEFELAEAKWFSREEIQVEDDGISLTREMIIKFKLNQFEIRKT